jgi:osmotically-inducible protein OsmY
MKTDSEIKKNVEEELNWESRIDGSAILVTVNEGFVTLSGIIDSYTKKMDAERTAMKVNGVVNVINELKVVIPLIQQKKDFEIKNAIVTAIKWNSSIDERRIKVSVVNGHVTLEGEVSWEYQKSRARNLAADIIGVTDVINFIKVVSNSVQSGAKEKIEAALKRNYYLNSSKIKVAVDGSKAILTGMVKSLEEKGAAETAAWSAPGINEVDNKLIVSFQETFM